MVSRKVLKKSCQTYIYTMVGLLDINESAYIHSIDEITKQN